MADRLLIFGWHNVDSSWCFPARPGEGRRGLTVQLKLLARSTRVLPLGEALQRLTEGVPLPPRATAITFDDGYRDNLDLAVPILEGLGLPATFFLVPDLLSGLSVAWWERLAWAFTCTERTSLTWEGGPLALADRQARRVAFLRVAERVKRRGRIQRDMACEELVAALAPGDEPRWRDLFLDWDGARALVGRGFDVGSHSLRHAILTQEEPAERLRDLTTSRQQLEAQLGVPIDLLAYPNGTTLDYDSTTIAAARDAGYAFAVTTVRGWNRPRTPALEMRRFVLNPEDGALGPARAGVAHAVSRARKSAR